MGNFIMVELSLFEHIVAITVLAVTIALILWLAVKSLLKRGSNRLTKTEATVLSKTTESYVNQPVFMQNNQMSAGLVENGIRYVIYFKTKDGKEPDFTVSKSMYEALREGQKDTLTYKGETLLQFGAYVNTPSPLGGSFKGLQEG